jgi:hypothetical protein
MRFKLEPNMLRITEISEEVPERNRLTRIELAILRRITVMTVSARKNGKQAFVFAPERRDDVREVLQGFLITPEELPDAQDDR